MFVINRLPIVVFRATFGNIRSAAANRSGMLSRKAEFFFPREYDFLFRQEHCEHIECAT